MVTIFVSWDIDYPKLQSIDYHDLLPRHDRRKLRFCTGDPEKLTGEKYDIAVYAADARDIPNCDVGIPVEEDFVLEDVKNRIASELISAMDRLNAKMEENVKKLKAKVEKRKGEYENMLLKIREMKISCLEAELEYERAKSELK